MAHWHSLAKLAMHSTTTIDQLSKTTVALGICIRNFSQNICPLFQTWETNTERNKRLRDAIRNGRSDVVNSQRQEKTFNLRTYKLHALGDYVFNIQLFGPTGSYNTQLVSSIF
jgi:hypothetical protein